MKFFLFPLYLCCITVCTAQNSIFDICRNGSVERLMEIHKKDKTIIDKKNDKGYTPLTIASYSNNIEVVKFLAKNVKDIDEISNFGTSLMAAVFKNNTQIVEVLLKNKANPNIKDKNGSTAMHYAVLNKNYDILILLSKTNADFTIKNNNGKSALDFAKSLNDEKINTILTFK